MLFNITAAQGFAIVTKAVADTIKDSKKSQDPEFLGRSLGAFIGMQIENKPLNHGTNIGSVPVTIHIGFPESDVAIEDTFSEECVIVHYDFGQRAVRSCGAKILNGSIRHLDFEPADAEFFQGGKQWLLQ
jgi:hypothetical protein